MNKSKLIEAATKKTPFYIFDYDCLKERVSILKDKLPKNATLCYAIKANPFLIPALKDENILFEVCSPGELSICENYRLNPSKIVFSGVCKTLEDVKRAYQLKVKTITLESTLHCQYLIETVKEAPANTIHKQEVILRLTSGNQFGMSKDNVKDCIKQLKEIDSIVIRGIHFFTGTQKKITKIADEVNFIVDFCNQLKQELSIDFTDIEYGPGLSFNYFSKEDEAQNYSEYDQFVSFIQNANYNFVIELGRYIASSCGYYVTSIMDVKTNESGNYCIIDGGINHINYYGQMMGMKIPPVEQIGKSKIYNEKKCTICGSLCTTADVVLRELILNDPTPGDLLIFGNIGAYSVTEGVYLFLSHPMPEIYIYENEQLICVRNTIETYSINSKQ